jgi:hypothetical protein
MCLIVFHIAWKYRKVNTNEANPHSSQETTNGLKNNSSQRFDIEVNKNSLENIFAITKHALFGKLFLTVFLSMYKAQPNNITAKPVPQKKSPDGTQWYVWFKSQKALKVHPVRMHKTYILKNLAINRVVTVLRSYRSLQ